MTTLTQESGGDTAPDGARHHGDHGVGFRQMTLKFGKSPLPVSIWYPTSAASRTVLFGPYAMRVSLNAAPLPGTRRLIALSHGSKGNPLGHRDTALHLAALGYTVAAPLHPHDNYLDDANSGTPALWRDRPFHVRQAVDAVLDDPILGAHLFRERIGMIGFSLGGYTALALLGANASLAALAEHRRRYPEDKLPVAPNVDALSLADLEALAAAGNADFPDARDERMAAAVLLAPMCALFSDGALARVSTPVALYCAEHDQMLREPYHAHRLSALLPAPPRFSVVRGAGHFSFLCPFPGSLQKELPELALDENFDRAAFHRQLNPEISEFLSHTLA